MVLVKNLNFFSSLYCRLNRPGKCFFFVTLESKRVFFYSKITKLKKSKFWYFSNGAGFGQKINLNFSIFFFLRKIGQENVFDHIVDRKKVF